MSCSRTTSTKNVTQTVHRPVKPAVQTIYTTIYSEPYITSVTYTPTVRPLRIFNPFFIQWMYPTRVWHEEQIVAVKSVKTIPMQVIHRNNFVNETEECEFYIKKK